MNRILSNSLIIGSFSVGTSSTSFHVNESGSIGVGTNTPTYKLEVAGSASVNGFRLTTGSSNGYVLTSDDNGVGTWTASSNLSMGYKEYIANLDGNGFGLTTSLTTQVFKNTLGFTPTWDFISTGNYVAVNPLFDPNKCWVSVTNNSGVADRTVMASAQSFPNTRILLSTFYNFNVPVDGLVGAAIEIRVYD